MSPSEPSSLQGSSSKVGTSGFLSTFIRLQSRLEQHKQANEPVVVDGHTLTVADVVAAARYASPVQLSSAADVRARVEKSQQAIEAKLVAGASVYGLSTGFGGSADTRTNASLVLGKSLLQHQHAGVISDSSNAADESSKPLPLNDPLQATSMPEAWVRAAILIRMNSLIRGHSGVRWKFIEALSQLLENKITPVVPLRGSISASGDLSPLSYVAGTLIGNPSIRAYSTAPSSKDSSSPSTRRIVTSREAYAEHGLSHVVFEAKEHLGLLNGTAFSAAAASLAVNEVMHVGVLSMLTTVFGTEALLGMQGSHDPFIHAIARPHPGQVEAAEIMHRLLEGSSLATLGEERELKLEEDVGKLRQDRYALRTSPQWLGPLFEDIASAVGQIEIECNSTTDNPLVDGETGQVHHGGNFQAMAISLAMDRMRLSLAHIGKLLFSQFTELLNPTMNRGLPPNLASTDPSVNYFAKGLDIAAAAYTSELGWLAAPVGSHVQSAEMHNQAVNSLALISARATIQSLEVLTMLISSYVYVLCQAIDIRAMQREFDHGVQTILSEELSAHFPALFSSTPVKESPLYASLLTTIRDGLESTTTMDAAPRMETVVQNTTTPLVNYFLTHAMGTSPSSTSASNMASEQTGTVAENATQLALTTGSPIAKSGTFSTSSGTQTPAEGSIPSSPLDSKAPLSSMQLLASQASPLAAAATAITAFSAIPSFRHALSSRMIALLVSLRLSYLTPTTFAEEKGQASTPAPTPAASLLAPSTRKVYTFVRSELGIRMHGWENVCAFDTALMGGSEEKKASGELGFSEADGSIGMNVTRIYEAIRDGRMQGVVKGVFEEW